MSRPAILGQTARQDLRQAVAHAARDNSEAAPWLRTHLEAMLHRLGVNPPSGAQALAEVRYRFLAISGFAHFLVYFADTNHRVLQTVRDVAAALGGPKP